MKRTIIFGEVLFDVFPDGESVLGGAPFNVAWNLRGFGLDPLFISAVGDDVYGDKALSTMEGWGLDTGGIFRYPEYPTGTVDVRFADGRHGFNIAPERAYDFISEPDAFGALPDEGGSLFCHGTLAARTPISGDTLAKLISKLDGTPRFHDVNIREPWCRKEDTVALSKGAAWVKMNDLELEGLAGRALLTGKDMEKAAEEYRAVNGIGNLVVTMGERGSFCAFPGEVVRERVVETEVVDTVGAGDAFSSVMILGAVYGWSAGTSMKRASEFASAICAIRGATCSDKEVFIRCLDMWGERR